MKPGFWIGIALVVLLLAGCRFDPRDGFDFSGEALTPLAFAELSLEDVLTDSLELTTNDQGFASLVYRDSIVSTDLTELVDFPDTTNRLVAQLDSLDLSPPPIEERITLAELARQLIAQGGINATLGRTLIDSQGRPFTLPIDIPLTSFANVPLDASQFFDYAKVATGRLRITIQNQLPVDLRNLDFSVSNVGAPPPLLEDQFSFIAANSQTSRDYDISGREITNQLEANIDNLTIRAGTFTVDTNDFFLVRIEALELTVESARAVFPAQTVLDSISEVVYRFPDEIRITKLVVASGKLRAFTRSTIQDTILFTYALPTARRNGEIPEITIKVNPAQPGIPSVQEQEVDLSGFTVDMSQGRLGANTLLQAYKMELVFSGRQVEITNQDQLEISFGLLEIEPVYVEGYFGNQEFVFEGEEAFDAFRDLDLRLLRFDQARAEIFLDNSVGADVAVNVNELRAINSESGRSVDLLGPANRAGVPTIARGLELPDTFGVVRTSLRFSEENGNLNDFINLLPDQFRYDIDLRLNPGGSAETVTNFASDKSRAAALIELELPLQGQIDRFIFVDTTEFTLSPGELSNIDEIQRGTLRFLLDNDFPLDARMEAVLLDENKEPIRSLTDDFLLAAGLVDPATDRVEEPTRSRWEENFERDELIDLIERGRYVAFRFRIDSSPTGESVRIFEDYRLMARLVARFDYSL